MSRRPERTSQEPTNFPKALASAVLAAWIGASTVVGNEAAEMFAKVTTGPVIWPSGGIKPSSIGSWGDFDGDGFLDLLVTTSDEYSGNFLYQNDRAGGFSQVAGTMAGGVVTAVAQTYAGSWGDYDNDGDLDIFLAGGTGYNNALYEYDGNSTPRFLVNDQLTRSDYSSLGISWADYDSDGYLDLFVGGNNPNGYGVRSFLYHNLRDGTFEFITDGDIVNDLADSWGNAWGDYDNDGDLDLFVTDYGPPQQPAADFLYRNDGDGAFTRILEGPVVTTSPKTSE